MRARILPVLFSASASVLVATAACVYDTASLTRRGSGGDDASVSTGGVGAAPVRTGGVGGLASGGGGGAGTGGRGGLATGGGGNVPAAGGGSSPSPATGGSPGPGGASGGGAPGAAGGAPATVSPDLVLWYPFDESTGMEASDASGFAGGPRNATLTTFGLGGSAMFTAAHRVGSHALAVVGNGALGGGYVTLPSLLTLAPQAITVATWVYATSGLNWQRIFDFGNDKTTTYMYLTIAEGADLDHVVRFAITKGGNGADEILNGSTGITVDEWHHLAVVLADGVPYTGTLYVDGVLSGENPAMTLHAADLGPTVHNFIGRSQYDSDSFLSGRIDDFRVYRRALGAAEIAALAATP